MKSWTRIASVLVVLGLCSFAMAARGAGKAGRSPDALKGEVVSVTPDTEKTDQTKIVVKSGGGKNAVAQEVTIIADANTTITVDGAAGKATDLKIGQQVTVTPATGTATKIEASTTPVKNGRKNK